MEINIVYITTKNLSEAKKIGRTLVLERLSGCINILDNMISMYWWEGKIQEDHETILIVKTRKDLIAQVIARVKKLHSASCPCILSIPVVNGNNSYLNWLRKETNGS